MFVITNFPHDPHAFHLRSTSLCISHAKNVLGFFHLPDSSNRVFSEKVVCDVNVVDLCCVQAASSIPSKREDCLKIVFS